MRTFYILLTTFVFSFSAYTQELKGKVIDQSTNLPISEAFVYSIDLQSGETTNTNGEFTFSKFTQYKTQLRISAQGYDDQLIWITSDQKEVEVKLLPMHVLLDEVVVSIPSGQLQGDNVTNITSVSWNDINEVPTTNMGEALKQIPGVYVSSIGSAISKPVIRGLSGTRVVTYSDGLRIENQQWGGDHGIGITSVGINRVEVIKGPASLLYGSDAMGGVMYFVESSYLPKNQWKSFAQTTFESNNLSHTTQAGTQFSKNHLKVNVFGAATNAVDYMMPNGYRVKNSRYNSQVGKLSVGYNTTNWLLNVRYSYSHSVNGIPGHTHETDVTPDLFYTNDITFEKTVPNQTINNHFLMIENKFFFHRSELHVQLGNTNNRLQEFEEKVTIPGLDMKLNSTTANVRYKYHLTEHLDWLTGFQGMYQLNSNDPGAEETLIPDATTTDAGVYTILYWNTKKWKAQAGVRADYRKIDVLDDATYAPTYNGYNYSAGIARKWKHHTTRLNVSTGFRAPHTSELLANGVHHGSFQYVIGDKNLKTENATQFDLAYEYHSEHLELVFNPYYNIIQNYIYMQKSDSMVGVYPVYYNVQNPLVNLYGGDIGIHYHPHFMHRLHIETNFTYTRAIDSEGNHLDLIPPARWNAQLKYELKGEKRFYVKNIIFQNSMVFAQREVAINETPSEFYNLINLGITGGFKIGKTQNLEWNAGVKNLLNTSYIDHLSSLKTLDLSGPGINGYVGLKWNINHKIN